LIIIIISIISIFYVYIFLGELLGLEFLYAQTHDHLETSREAQTRMEKEEEREEEDTEEGISEDQVFPEEESLELSFTSEGDLAVSGILSAALVDEETERALLTLPSSSTLPSTSRRTPAHQTAPSPTPTSHLHLPSYLLSLSHLT
jgi:hypothetical protein